ncbi:hypothetical protein B0H14DRAFT_2974575 [Mycena olivaceomarginata]|nr:hypothetical protein B0H14DRAFT_2974575 [Mycena olivaceomarginata]
MCGTGDSELSLRLSLKLPELESTLYQITQRVLAMQSERFCPGDADMTISSSDGVTFKVHRKHLEVHSDVFADAVNATEIVKLSETSAVLDLLFQYPQPDLKSVDFPVFAGLAEAAEKYVVYSALPAVATQMNTSVIQYPLQVLDYAARHNHKELAKQRVSVSLFL